MTVFRVVLLDCSTPECRERFVPARPTDSTVQLRAEARRAGWLTNWRNRGSDFGPVCAVELGLKFAKPRGICSVCGEERSITANEVMQKHPVPGQHHAMAEFQWCPGGGRAPGAVLSKIVTTREIVLKALI